MSLANQLRAIAECTSIWRVSQCTSLWRGAEFQKAVLKAGLCFHRYVHFACVPIYTLYYIYRRIHILCIYYILYIYILTLKSRG